MKNKLTAIRSTEKRWRGNVIWEFQCDCGNIKESTMYKVSHNDVKSCGCLVHVRPKRGLSPFKGKGKQLHKKYARIYRIWAQMKYRCGKEPYYKNISYDLRWKKFENFLIDMGDAPIGYSIDRKDSKGNYCKENCRWTTFSEQIANRTKYDINGERVYHIEQNSHKSMSNNNLQKNG